MVPSTPEAVHISLPVPAAVRATAAMAGPVGHALPVSWLGAPQQLAPGRDMDLPHAETSHAGQDAGMQGRSHNARGLAEDHERQGAQGARASSAAGQTHEASRRAVHLVEMSRIDFDLENVEAK